jgi:hypothetical protein
VRGANAITEEVRVEKDEIVAVVVVDDGKVSCDVCGKRYKASGLKTHKAAHKKNNNSAKIKLYVSCLLKFLLLFSF